MQEKYSDYIYNFKVVEMDGVIMIHATGWGSDKTYRLFLSKNLFYENIKKESIAKVAFDDIYKTPEEMEKIEKQRNINPLIDGM